MIREILPNGIELLLAQDHFSKVVAIQCWVRVGSLDESAAEAGMSHYLEHMLFKGTTKRAVGEIAATVESCGGDINAYTTFDRTVFYLTLASRYLDTGVDLLADAIFHSSFDGDEFEREREVILEEIKRSLDDPGAKVGRKVFETAYGNADGTGMGRPIIGSDATVRSFTRDQLAAFHSKWYQPQNMSVVIVGDFEIERARKLANQYFGTATKSPLPNRTRQRARPLRGINTHVIKGDYKQPRLEIAFRVPELEHADTAALDLAAFVLGSGDLARFNRKLRDDQQVLTSASCSVYSPLTEDGLFEASVFAGEGSLLVAGEAVCREIMALIEKEPVTDEELARARANLKADRVYRDETVGGQARSLGYALMTKHKEHFDDAYWSDITAVTSEAVSAAVKLWLNPENVVIVALLPETSPLQTSDFESACKRGLSIGAGSQYQNKESKTAPSKAIFDASQNKTLRSVRSAAQDDVIVSQLKPGIRLVYKRNPHGKIFSLVAATEGGLRAETSPGHAGLYCAMSGLLAKASDEFSYDEMLGAVESLGASLDGFSGKDSFGFQVSCLTDHVDILLKLFASALLNPEFPGEQWTSLQREILEAIKAKDDSPAGVCIRNLQEQIFGEHPYAQPTYGRADSVSAFTAESLLEQYLGLRDAGSWVISCVGNMEPAALQDKLQSILAEWRPSASRRAFSSDQKLNTGKPGKRAMEKEREQTHLAIGYPGINWADHDRPALDVLIHILGGHGGRLFRKLRDRDSLAYTVSPMISYGQHPGAVGSYIACAPAKVEKALSSLINEMAAMATDLVTTDELSRARNYIIGSHEIDLQRCDSQTMTMALMELYGIGYDDYRRYGNSIAQVTQKDVHRVASRLLVDSRRSEVVVGSGVSKLLKNQE